MVVDLAAHARSSRRLDGGEPPGHGTATRRHRQGAEFLRRISGQLPALQRLSSQQRPSQELIHMVFFFSSIFWPLL